MKIRWAGPALRELEAALDYIAKDAPGAADRIGHEVHNAVGRLARFPDMGRMVPETGDPALREIIALPFRVMYERGPEAIRVLAVIRCERNPDFGEIQER